MRFTIALAQSLRTTVITSPRGPGQRPDEPSIASAAGPTQWLPSVPGPALLEASFILIGMIIVTATVTLQPGKLEAALELARKLQAATQAEPGCISYCFYQDLLEPNRIFVFEQWESEAALDAHFASEHMTAFQRSLPGLIATMPVVTIYDVSGQRSL